jgi:hypothetical protein
MYSPYLLKTPQKYSKIHVLCKSNLWYSTPESVDFLQSAYISTLTLEVSLQMSNSKNFLPWVIPMSPSI